MDLDSRHALLACALVVWCVLHSAMISLRWTAFVERRFGARYRFYRAVFNTVALLTFLPIVFYERHIDGPTLFDWTGLWLGVRGALLGLALLLFVLGARRYDLRTFLGLRQIQGDSAGKSLTAGEGLDTSGVLGHVRHPWYTGAMIVIWARPLDAAALVTNAILTGYLVIGTYLEERKLVIEFGDTYREYQRRVGMFLPLRRVRKPTTSSIFLLLAVLAMQLSSATLAAEKPAPLRTVDQVDLDRYSGMWFEIASYPAWFQRNCTATTAEYIPLANGSIRVLNRCRKGSPDGKEKTAKGKATIVDASSNAKLKVSFFWPFKGDYWIIDLDPDYRWAVVGQPSRKYLWILSRTPTLEESEYDAILDRLTDQGYDPSKLVLTTQATASESGP